MGARTRVRRVLDGIRPWDVAVAAAVATIAQQEVWAPLGGVGWSHRTGPVAVLAAAYLAAAATLLWRRRAPMVVVAVVAVVLSAYYLAFGAPDGLGALLPPVFAFYAAGRYGNPRRFGAALAVTAAAVAIHEWRDPQFTMSGPAVVFWAVVLAAGLVGRAFTTSAREVEAIAGRARQLEHEREAQAQAAVAAERARIARELHDLVGHGISLMVLQLVASQGDLEQGHIARTQQRLAGLETTARTTLAEIRRLVSVTDDDERPLAPQPGLADIARLVDNVRDGGLPVVLEMTGCAEAPAGVGLAAYRIVQEALTNVMKHARPAVGVGVAVTRSPDKLVVEVHDGGAGPVGDLGVGRGLTGMRERVALYGGTLDVGPRTDGGFGVRASFPLAQEAP